MNSDLKRLLMIGFLVTMLVSSIYGANRWFRRGSSSCANGQCSTVDVVPEPTPVVIPTPTPAPMPDNIVLDNTKSKNKSQEGPSATNDLLGPPDSCDCKTCKCKECVCENCKCEKCPGKKVVEKKRLREVIPIDNNVEAEALPDPVDVEYQYEYVPRRRGLFGRWRR